MKTYKLLLLSITIISFLQYSCKKNNIDQPISPIIVADSSFQIIEIRKIDINKFEINYAIKPPENEEYKDVYLYWGNVNDTIAVDSTLLSKSVSAQTINKFSLQGLKQATPYSVRISLIYKGKRFYSLKSNFTTEKLRIESFPKVLNRNGTYYYLTTNLVDSPNGIDTTSTRVYLDNILCNVIRSTGRNITFTLPVGLTSKNYCLRFERDSLVSSAPDSVCVPLGIWGDIEPPNIPASEGWTNAIGFYGSCFNSQKGFLVPGYYYRSFPFGDPNFGRPDYILEFDFASKKWAKKYPQNPQYFTRPICYYFNNSIYVIAGEQVDKYDGSYKRVDHIMKLDLGSLSWSQLDSVPYYNKIFMPSFALNNEWYIGVGNDVSVFGWPEFSKKFWKYSPVTNSWTQLPDFPVDMPVTAAVTSFSVNNEGYIYFSDLSDRNPRGKRMELWKYSPSLNIWNEVILPDTPELLPGSLYSIVSHNDKVYFFTAEAHSIGLSGNFAYTQPTYLEYDPLRNSFKKISSNHPKASIMQCIGKFDNKLYFQEDALGQIEHIWNKTYEFSVE